MKKPTLDTLAAELGVSRQTVSNALNRPHKVGDATRQRVLAAIEASGYRPSAAARALRTQQTYNLALRMRNIADGINGAVMDGFLHALVLAAGQRGYRIVLFSARDESEEIAFAREFAESKAVDGVILTDTHSGDERPGTIMELGLPVVAFGRPWAEGGQHSWVDVDGAAGVSAATSHLLSEGNSPVGFIGWPADADLGSDRRRGWVEASGYSAAEQERFSERRPDSLEAGREAMAALHSRGITAVVCTSDSLAMGARAYFRDQGIDGQVIGFDDTPVAQMVGLSSIRQPVEDVAEHLTELMISRIRDPHTPPQHILLPATLQIRPVAEPS